MAPAGVAALCFLTGLSSCGTKEGPVDTGSRLCGGAADVALRIEGGGNPLEFCAGSDSVSATLTPLDRYDVTATSASGGVHYELQMLMHRRDDWPVKLTVTESLAEVSTNPDAVWVYYQETPGSGAALESYAASGGTFTLSFSDDKVAAGTMSGVSLRMRQTLTGTDAGARLVTEGFFTFATRLSHSALPGNPPVDPVDRR